jgi:16S rRNA (cytosine1402-N4)-methyltransferase
LTALETATGAPKWASDYHHPVLLHEVIAALQIKSDGVYVDGTLGGAGHSLGISEKLASRGKLIAIDRDADAIAVASERLPMDARIVLWRGNYGDYKVALHSAFVNSIDGFLLDLGVSSWQLNEVERGFTFSADAPLDMRMDRSMGQTASELLSRGSEKELADIFYLFGEERKARPLARVIVNKRKQNPIERSSDLRSIVQQFYQGKSLIKALARVFQALRIAVNNELDVLKETLSGLPEVLNPGARVVVISYHSLEDRLVKQQMRYWAQSCICPPQQPVCICTKQPQVEIIKPFPQTPSVEEVALNSRSRSAKMRVCEMLGAAA